MSIDPPRLAANSRAAAGRQRRQATAARLLAAAEQVFARDGLSGATTRAIARAARVNEVTLFRHFGTKERLLAAVLGQTFRGRSADPASGRARGDLRADLAAFARRYEELLREHLPLIRTLLGEIHRHRANERRVLHGIFQPTRANLVRRLEEARAAGEIRAATDPEVVADLLSGMIFSGVIRSASPLISRPYSLAQYQESCLDTLLGGIAAPGKARP
jgi:AcrR family transcriptional regulator